MSDSIEISDVPLELLEVAKRAPPAQMNRIRAAFTGRPPGALNRCSLEMKDAILSVYADLQAGFGDANFKPSAHADFFDWARNNRTEFYRFATKLVPLQLRSENVHRVGMLVMRGLND